MKQTTKVTPSEAAKHLNNVGKKVFFIDDNILQTSYVGLVRIHAKTNQTDVEYVVYPKPTTHKDFFGAIVENGCTLEACRCFLSAKLAIEDLKHRSAASVKQSNSVKGFIGI